MAVAINALELAFPRLPFLPWLKPGLSNTITILWIVKYGVTDALLFAVIRIWISGFYFGFSLLTMSLGLGGGILATVSMGLVWKVLGTRQLIGSIGLGIIGALFHNLGQLMVIYLLIARNFRILYQLPFMIFAAIVLGGAVGALVPVLARFFENSEAFDQPVLLSKKSTSSPGVSDKAAVAVLLFVSVALLLTTNIVLLAVAASSFTLISLLIQKGKIAVLLYPLKFYWIFLFIGFLHLFFSFGTRLEHIPFITSEGLQKAVIQWIRLWAWLQATHIFKRFRFHDIFFSVLGRAFPNKSSTLDAGIMALELFPETVAGAKKNSAGRPITSLFTKPAATLRNYVQEMNQKIGELISEKNRAIRESEAE